MNEVFSLLCRLGLCDAQSAEDYYPRVRDRTDVSVRKCRRSGVIFLSRSDHIDSSHYEQIDDFGYWGVEDRNRAAALSLPDNSRREAAFLGLIINKTWLDVGTGSGGILDLLGSKAARVLAVEPQRAAREALMRDGYEMFETVEEVPRDTVEVATLFHVFEHLLDPVGTLKSLRERMVPGGQLIVEVPHARDFLLAFLELEAFKAFTFWSEHLVLHTRASLSALLEAGGFANIVISGVQRYPLANHLRWLSKQQPGGHILWNQLRSNDLDVAYEAMLAGIDHTDTLVAVAEKPSERTSGFW